MTPDSAVQLVRELGERGQSDGPTMDEVWAAAEARATYRNVARDHFGLVLAALEAQACHGVFDPDAQRQVACEPHLRCTRCQALAAVAEAAKKAGA